MHSFTKEKNGKKLIRKTDHNLSFYQEELNLCYNSILISCLGTWAIILT